MALRRVTRKPDRQVVVFLLLLGGNFQAYMEGRATLLDMKKATVPLTRAQVEAGVEKIDPRPFTTTAPPGAQWVPGWALLDCDTFATASEDLEPGDYSQDGTRIAYLDAGGQYVEDDEANLIITRDGQGNAITISRKP